MAILTDEERRRLAEQASGYASPSNPQSGSAFRDTLSAQLQNILAQNYNQAAGYAGDLSSWIQNSPEFQSGSMGLGDLAYNQPGREQLLNRVVGSSSSFGYSPAANRLDAYLLGAAGQNSFQNLQDKRTAILKSLGLYAPGAILPSTNQPLGQDTAPGASGNTPGGVHSVGATAGGNQPPSWSQWASSLASMKLPLPQQTSGRDIQTQPPAAYQPTYYNPPQPTYRAPAPAPYTPPKAPTYQQPAPKPASTALFGGTGSQLGGVLTQASDYQKALQRYQTYGINSLDSYERGLLGLSGTTSQPSYSNDYKQVPQSTTTTTTTNRRGTSTGGSYTPYYGTYTPPTTTYTQPAPAPTTSYADRLYRAISGGYL